LKDEFMEGFRETSGSDKVMGVKSDSDDTLAHN
jgi:hypothetical protein